MITTTRKATIAVSNWWNLVWITMAQLLSSYGRAGRLSFIMALLEPVLLILLLYVIRGIFRMGTASFGTSLFLFMASGFLPFYLFLHISSRTRTAGSAGARLPGLTSLDVTIAIILLNSLIWIGMTVAIFAGMWLYGIDQAWPDSIVEAITPLLLLIVMGMGIGMINNVIGRYFWAWLLIYRMATRGLIFLSGVFFIVDLQPLWMRAWMIPNPLTHGITWFRVGIYGNFPQNSLDRTYLLEWALIALFLGMVLDRAGMRAFAKT
ncbi:ABC transporter permease [Reyranella sp.]|uniref:ABC transporter permease n=1 Tax=Reyranella sp. TaxID=1929291 RepID=UPI003BAB5913